MISIVRGMKAGKYLTRGTGAALLSVTLLSARPVIGQEVKTEKPEPRTEPEKKEQPVVEEFKLNPYGSILANYIYSSGAVLSGGRENIQAMSQAKRHTQADDSSSQSGIVVNQTLLGIKPSYGNRVQGGVEVDFVDFNKATPYTNANPRIRQAYVDVGVAEDLTAFVGMKLDIFSPLSPDFYNPVGAMRPSGNVGFQREQAGLFKKMGAWSAIVAFGNTTANITPSPVISAEQNKSPTGAFQIKFAPSKEAAFYVSAITANVAYRAPLIEPSTRAGTPLEYNGSATAFPMAKKMGGDGVTRRASSGASLGFDGKPIEGLTMKVELNWGRNLGNINGFGISSVQRRTTLPELDNGLLSKVSTTAPASSGIDFLRTYKAYNSTVQYDSTEEAGGWFSVVYLIAPFEIGAFGGTTKITRWENRLVAPGLATDLSLSQADPATGIWSAAQQSSVKQSSTAGLTFAWIVTKGTKLFLSLERYETVYFVPEREKGFSSYVKSINLDTGAVTMTTNANPFGMPSPKAVSNVVRAGVQLKF